MNFESISSPLAKGQKLVFPSQKSSLAEQENGNPCADKDLGCLPTAPLPLDALPLWRAAAPKAEVEWILCNPGCILGNGLESSCVKDSSLLVHARTSRFPVTSPSYPQSLCPYQSQGGIFNLLFAILSARNFL